MEQSCYCRFLGRQVKLISTAAAAKKQSVNILCYSGVPVEHEAIYKAMYDKLENIPGRSRVTDPHYPGCKEGFEAVRKGKLAAS